jgi:hypothetical protein
MPFNDDTRFACSDFCTVRRQEAHYLIYNTRTDELYLIPLAAYPVLELCHGQYTLAEITRALAAVIPLPVEEARPHLEGFLEALIQRGVIQELRDGITDAMRQP